MSSCLAYLLPDPERSTSARLLLVVGYVVAAFCWLRASRRDRTGPDSSSGWWLLGAVLLFLLAINKQFNVRGLCEAGFRTLAQAGNWYDRRQPMQFVLAIVLPCVLAACTGVFLVTKARRFVRGHPLALAGWALLLLYLALRQTQEWKPSLRWLSAIHYHDWRLALEAAGMLLVILAPLLEHRPPAKGRECSFPRIARSKSSSRGNEALTASQFHEQRRASLLRLLRITSFLNRLLG